MAPVMTYTEQEWWDEWGLTWHAIGWRVLVGRLGPKDTGDVLALLVLRVAHLEREIKLLWLGGSL